MTRLPAAVAVTAVAVMVLSGCAPGASTPSAASASYTDIPATQTVRGDDGGALTVHTRPEPGDTITLREVTPDMADPANPTYTDVGTWTASQSGSGWGGQLVLVHSPLGDATLWAVTPEQLAAHPDLTPAGTLAQ